jgi:hypothetical protein
MSRALSPESPFDPRSFAARLLRAVPWAVGAALLAGGGAAFVDSRVPPVYQAALSFRLTPPPGPLPAGVPWPLQPGDAVALLLGCGTRDEVARDPGARRILAEGGPEDGPRLAAAYARKVSAFPGTAGALWVVARDIDPARAQVLARLVVEAAERIARAGLEEARGRLEATWSAAGEKHLAEIREIDAALARSGNGGARDGRLPAESERLLARRRIRVKALEGLEEQRLSVDVAGLASARPWLIDGSLGDAGIPAPRDRVRPVLGPALFAAAAAVLLRLLHDGRPRHG